MGTIRISKIKFRKGLDSQIKSTIYDQGEPVTSIDTKRLFIGTGSGKFVVGNKNFLPITNFTSLTSTKAEIGDIISYNNSLYQLTLSDYTDIDSWVDITSLAVDTNVFTLSSNYTLSINPSSLSPNLINPLSVLSGVKIENGILQTDLGVGLTINSNKIDIDYNTKNFELSGGKFTIKEVDERELATTSFTNGITGGAGNKVGIKSTNEFKILSGDTLSINLTTLTNELSSVLDVDNNSISRVGGKIQINNTPTLQSSYQELPILHINSYGLVDSLSSSIYDAVIGDSSLSGYNSTSPLSSIFNGNPYSDNLSGLSALSAFQAKLSGSNITYFSVVSASYDNLSTTVVTLSSAGFIFFENPTTTRTGKNIKRFAIPIFTY